MLVLRIQEHLDEQKRSVYWLAKNTGLNYVTVRRLVKNKAKGIKFDTLDRISAALSVPAKELLEQIEDETE